MSKITTNLNSIINTFCDNRYAPLTERMESAARVIFNYEYIEDEEARKIFENLFLSEYIDRNIYTPSVRLWLINLQARLQSAAPVFNHNMEVLKTNFKDIFTETVTDTTTDTDTDNKADTSSQSVGTGTANNTSISSKFPQDLISVRNIKNTNYAENGQRSEGDTSQSMTNESHATGESSTKTISNQTTKQNADRLKLLEQYQALERNLIYDLVRELKDMFLIIL